MSIEFESFMKKNGIRHIRSSPYHPSSNGLAERVVQCFKKGMKKYASTEALETRLLFWYRLTSYSTTGIAPAQLLFGRIPRSQLDLLKQSSRKKFVKGNNRKRTITTDTPNLEVLRWMILSL